jgi:pyruvate/2-oxoglutarate dehydrogenase complex dihydrolipoamide acyltransferase (E2) component
LAGIKVQPGTDVPVGETIAWIVAPGEAIPTDEHHANSENGHGIKHGKRYLRKTWCRLFVEFYQNHP